MDPRGIDAWRQAFEQLDAALLLDEPARARFLEDLARADPGLHARVQSVLRGEQLAGRYANPQQLSQAIQKGEIWEGNGALRIQTRSLILPMDEMTILVNGATYLATRIDCKTQHEGSPVAIAIDYQQMPNGPSVMARMTVQIPEEHVVVNVESYDFVRRAAGNIR